MQVIAVGEVIGEEKRNRLLWYVRDSNRLGKKLGEFFLKVRIKRAFGDIIKYATK
jgi:hypothetical protein